MSRRTFEESTSLCSGFSAPAFSINALPCFWTLILYKLEHDLTVVTIECEKRSATT